MTVTLTNEILLQLKEKIIDKIEIYEDATFKIIYNT